MHGSLLKVFKRICHSTNLSSSSPPPLLCAALVGDAAQFDRGVDGERQAGGIFDFGAQHADILQHVVVEIEHAPEAVAAPEIGEPDANAGDGRAAQFAMGYFGCQSGHLGFPPPPGHAGPENKARHGARALLFGGARWSLRGPESAVT